MCWNGLTDVFTQSGSFFSGEEDQFLVLRDDRVLLKQTKAKTAEQKSIGHFISEKKERQNEEEERQKWQRPRIKPAARSV